MQLTICGPLPLSWCEEGEKMANGYRKRPIMVGRRIFGPDAGKAVWAITRCESDRDRLGLYALEADGARAYLHTSFPPPDGFDSIWHAETVSRAVRCAEHIEADIWNRTAPERPAVAVSALPQIT